MKMLTNILRYLRRPQNDVSFIHHARVGQNIGDILCSPRHYFGFASEKSVLIVGGGAFNDFGKRRATRSPAEVKIAWGIGQSWPFAIRPEPPDASMLQRTYAVASTRDPSFASATGIPLIPCASVLHPIVETPIGDRPGLFINQDASASGDNVEAILCEAAKREPSLVTASNALDGASFAIRFAQTRTITTNSYHAAYWALLSGRSVRLIGYSTKFSDLLSLLELPADALTRYRRGSGEELRSAIDEAEQSPPVRLEHSGEVTAHFRARNVDFAQSLRGLGVEAIPKLQLAP